MLLLVLACALDVGKALAQTSTAPGGEGPRRRLVFGGDSGSRPYEYLDQEGRPQGFNVELVRALGREAGFAVEVRLGAWGQLMGDFDAGRVDLMALAYSEERAQRYDFVSEIWTMHQVVVFPPGRPSYPRDLSELRGETVAVASRGKLHELLRALPEGQRPSFRLTPTVAEAMRAMARGEATGAGANVLTLRYEAAALGLHDLVELHAQSVPYLLAVKKGRSAELAWIPATMAALKGKGEFARLVERNLALPAAALTWRDYARPIAVALLAVAVLGAAGAVWNASLRRQVAARTSDLATLLQVKDRLAAEVRESEARYRQLVESIQGILWQADERMTCFTFVSQEAESILGYPPEAWRAEPGFWAAHVHPEDLEPALARCAEAAREARPQQFDFRMKAADGRLVWLRMLVRVAEEEGPAPALAGVMLDVTEHKTLEDQFRHAQKMEAVGRLAGGVAHDFNNILTAITGYTDLLLRRLSAHDPLRHKAESIRKAADRAADLTTRLLAFGRKQVLAPRVLDVNAVVSGMEGMLRPLLGEEIRLVTALARGLWPVKADRGQLEQVIMNLAVNARDAMPQGGTLTLETANRERPPDAKAPPGSDDGRHVMLAVRDTGTGMDAGVQSHLFEPFFTTKEPGRGTGLGLAIVYGIVQQSGGQIVVESAPGRGSMFRVYLPRAEARPAGVEAAGTSATEPIRGSETILLAEDEDAVRDLVGEVLRSGGYSVLEARHAGEALLIAERHSGPIHLLLTDVVMPHMGGRELAQRVAPLRPDTKVLFVSGYTDDGAMRNDLVQDQVHFLAKPFTPDDLMRKVREALGAPIGV